MITNLSRLFLRVCQLQAYVGWRNKTLLAEIIIKGTGLEKTVLEILKQCCLLYQRHRKIQLVSSPNISLSHVCLILVSTPPRHPLDDACSCSQTHCHPFTFMSINYSFWYLVKNVFILISFFLHANVHVHVHIYSASHRHDIWPFVSLDAVPHA